MEGTPAGDFGCVAAPEVFDASERLCSRRDDFAKGSGTDEGEPMDADAACGGALRTGGGRAVAGVFFFFAAIFWPQMHQNRRLYHASNSSAHLCAFLGLDLLQRKDLHLLAFDLFL
jgi:hypothetical protein